jgi:hypothetical protein
MAHWSGSLPSTRSSRQLPTGMYDSLKFTTETVNGRKIYLEWEGSVFGEDVGATTILTRDATDLIENIRFYHRPLQVVIEFSKELARRLKGKVDPDLLGASE